MTTFATRPAPPPRTQTAGWFRAFWRWHFYASVLVVPFLLMLAVTGLIYLLRFQIEPVMHADLMKVEQPSGSAAQAQPAGQVLPYAYQLSVVQKRYPAIQISSMAEPRDAGRSTVFSGVRPDGSPRDVFVNPYTGKVLGTLNPDHTLSGLAIGLHGDLLIGPWGDYTIELAACWAVVMAITGYLLYFQGRRARMRRLARQAKGSVLRNRHSWIGAIAGVGILGLVVTGLPWTGFWGKHVQDWTAGHGTSLWGLDPGAISNPASTLDESLPHSHATDIPWGLGKNDVPSSTEPAAGSEVSVANLDTAVLVGERNGLHHPMTVTLPDGETGVYSAIGYAFHHPDQERTVHIDRFGGRVVSAYGYADYPRLAKAVTQGIALHEGRRFGVLNFWVTLFFALGIIALCVTGPMMWWRRRPSGGGLSAPRGKLAIRQSWWVAPLLIALGLFLPLFGASLLLVLLLDQFVLRRVPRLRSTFAVTD